MTTETTTPVRKRPTVADIYRLESELDEERTRRAQAEAHADNAQSNLDAAIAARDAALGGDLEARCLDGCVRAIEAMHGAKATSQRNRPLYERATEFGVPRSSSVPSAFASDVGRVLLSLAARYGVEIEPVRPPDVETVREGQRIISVPAHVADQLERMAPEGFSL